MTMFIVGMVFQHFSAFFPSHVSLKIASFAPIETDDQLVRDGLLEKVGLADKANANQPFQVIKTACHRVDLLHDIMLFDEPTSALDPEMVGDVLVL